MNIKARILHWLMAHFLLVCAFTFQKTVWADQTGCTANQFLVTTSEDTEVKFHIQDFHKGIPLAETILVSRSPAHGSLACSTTGQQSTDFDLDGEQCSTAVSYMPTQDYSGEDTFAYRFLYENLTTISAKEYEVRLIVRPRPDDITAEPDKVTMKRSEGFVHIPVLANDKYRDKSDLCFTKSNPNKKQDAPVEVTFKNIAGELGIDAIQSAIPKSPDCLFDHYDPTLKTWIKGSFCLPEQNCGAGATADYDNDGFMDIYYARVDGADQLWRNLGNGSFQLATAEANLRGTLNHRSAGVAWVDVDNDGDMDLIIGTIAENRFYFYINDGMGHFTEDAVARGLAMSPQIPPYKTCTMTVAVGDYNKDGWLDLYTTEWLPHLDLSYDYNNGNHSLARLLKNLGAEGKPGYFEDVTAQAGLNAQRPPVTLADKFAGHTDLSPYRVQNVGLFKDIMPGAYIISAMLSDIDDDGYLDLAIAGDFFTSRLYWGTENGTFVEGAKETMGIGQEENGMGSTVADFDNDGKQDWFVTSIYMSEEFRKPYFEAYGNGGGMIFGYTGNRLYKNQGSRKFSDETDVVGVRPGWWAWGAAFFDFDNDGDLDLIHTNGFDDTESTDFDFLHHTATLLYESKVADSGGDLHFESVGEKRGITDRQDGRGLFVFDYDNDGDQDVFIVSNCEKPVFYRNDGGDSRDWIRVKVLEAECDRESVGAKVYLDSPTFKVELVREIRSVAAFSAQGEYIAHFGLGRETVEKFRVRVYWPVTNNTRVIHNVSRRTTLVVRDLRGRRNSVEVTTTPEESVGECRKMEVTSISKEPGHGRVVRHHNHVTYYPAPGFTGEDTFEYVVSDGLTSSTGQVKVKVEKSEEAEQLQKDEDSLQKWATFSGHGNNLQHPNLGRAMTPLKRLCIPGYDDGYETPAGATRSNPRNISNTLGNQKVDVYSPSGLNEIHMHFGQFIAHDVDFSTPYANTLPTENFAISVPTGDAWFDPYSTGTQTMRFRRSAHAGDTGQHHGVTREQVNKVSSFLDLSVIYASDDDRALALRSGIDGKLHEESRHNLGFNTKQLPNLNLLGGPRDKLLLSGDPRVNVQPGLICLHTLWAREHNLVCDELKKQQDLERYDDETLFQHARTITRAKWQAIVWNEFLPTVIGLDEFRKIPRYEGYNASLKVGVFNEFATAAFRYGHSQVGNTMQRLDEHWQTLGSVGNLELRDAYFNPGRVLAEEGIEPLIRGMLKQRAQKVDTLFADAVRNFLFGTNTQGLDLVTYGIQRGRDHGLGDYNSVRKALGLEPRSGISGITSDAELQRKLADVYPNVDDIDLWIGGLAEPHVPGGCVGETFAKIIAKQFQLLRDGDRYWFESPELYPKTVRMTIYRDVTLADIISRNTNIAWSGKTFFVDEKDAS